MKKVKQYIETVLCMAMIAGAMLVIVALLAMGVMRG